uniref:Uncharacterized protein n=1 Tax=Papio anubis TaxID=9555 RepID=A0A8I5NZ95_PAPAN
KALCCWEADQKAGQWVILTFIFPLLPTFSSYVSHCLDIRICLKETYFPCGQSRDPDAEENLEPTGRVLKQCGPLWEEGGSGARIFGNQGLNEGSTENNKARASPSEENKANKNQLAKVTNKQRREQQRLEKKKRQEERHRHKALESRGSHRDNNRSEAEANTQVTLVKTFAALNI